jgi:putative glutamine transport system substrate-binding protein
MAAGLAAIALAAACRSTTPPEKVPAAARPAAAPVESSTTAASRLARIRERGKLVVLDRGEEERGVHRDPAHKARRTLELALAREIAVRILGEGAQLELHGARRVDRIPALLSGEADLSTVPIEATAENRFDLDFSAPYAHDGPALLVARDGEHFQEIAALAKKTVAATTEDGRFLGAELEQKAASARIDLSVSFFNTFDQAAAAVSEHRVDALLGLSQTIGVYVEGAPLFDRIDGLFPEEPCSVAVKKGESELLESVNATIRDLQASGRLATLATESGIPASNVVR